MKKMEYEALAAVLRFVRGQHPTPAARAALDEVIEEFCIVERERNEKFQQARFEVLAGYHV